MFSFVLPTWDQCSRRSAERPARGVLEHTLQCRNDVNKRSPKSMCDPIASYSDWIRAAKQQANRIATGFVPFMGQFAAMLQSIETTGFLPTPIQGYTASFIDDVYNTFAKRVPQLPRQHKDEGKVCDKFCRLLLRFAFYGLNVCEKTMM